ncbi:zinc finger BED domain-containing protein RICESLEEPER [Trifolium repens]|nr:zinc finger BED domain-containing protein RICESLEEPER [Trifolium repens]
MYPRNGGQPVVDSLRDVQRPLDAWEYFEIDMESFGNSALLGPQGVPQQAPGIEGSSNASLNGLTPLNETVETPNGETETAANMDTGDNIEALAEIANNRRRNVVWKHFTKMKVNDLDKARCKYCKKFLGGKSTNGTKHLLHHMDRCLHKKIHDNKTKKGQTFLVPKNLQGKQEIGVGTYNAENSRKEFACVIIMHEYPLSIVEHTGFERFVSSLQPVFRVPCRNTIKKEIFKVYEFEMAKALKLLDSLQSRVAITSYMWTAINQKKGYMVVTAHYIDGSWNLQSCILRFIYVPAPHSSDRLCAALVKCLVDWNIDTKLSTITLDNCSTNDAMINKIKEKLNLNTLLRDESLLHMRCVAHILNLIVKDGFEVLKDGIDRIRDSVAYWTATGKRKEKFEKIARQL